MQTQSEFQKPSINQRFEAWKQRQGRARIILFWVGLWAFAALFCLATLIMLRAATPPTKLEFFLMAVIGIGFYCGWPLIIFCRKGSTP
jgi:hypothetical protein